MNRFISTNFMCKGSNGTFPGCTSGILLTLHSPGWYDVLGGQFNST